MDVGLNNKVDNKFDNQLKARQDATELTSTNVNEGTHGCTPRLATRLTASLKARQDTTELTTTLDGGAHVWSHLLTTSET